jgi:GNAT superfamily N-acetyltransferase
VTPGAFRITVEPQASGADVATVEAGLLAFNVAKIGPPNESPVRIFLRDADGRVVGGLLGHIRWRWLYVAKLWVEDSLRGQGHGASLMNAAEEHARSLGCTGAYVDTFEYQARPFYEKLGYALFGTLEDYPPGYRQFHLVKRLSGVNQES